MTDAITQNKQQLNKRVAEVRSDPDLNNEAKQRMMKEAYDEAAKRHGELMAEREEEAARELTQLEHSVFRLNYPKDAVSSRDKEVFRQSYRDAAFKVFGMDAQDLERVLERAERIGDAQLAQAVYHESVERGLTSVAEHYRKSHPDAQKRWERYVQARRAGESVEGMFRAAINTQAPERPRELAGGPR